MQSPNVWKKQTRSIHEQHSFADIYTMPCRLNNSNTSHSNCDLNYICRTDIVAPSGGSRGHTKYIYRIQDCTRYDDTTARPYERLSYREEIHKA